jgi:hypothetical protein
VRYWQAWNEPNINVFLSPQYEGGRPFSPGWYRRMVNEFAAGVKAAHAGNLVVAAGTSPSGIPLPRCKSVNPRWGPLTFMRELFCHQSVVEAEVQATGVRFDIWAHHPYRRAVPRIRLPFRTICPWEISQR